MRSREAGYSLLEVLAASALLAIALLAGAYMQQALTNARANTTAQALGRKLVSDVIMQILDNPERFPYMIDGANKPIVFVGCFSQYGQQIQAASTAPNPTSTDWQGTSSVSTASAAAFSTIAKPGGSFVCPQNNGGWEVHVFPGQSDPLAGTTTNFQVAAIFVGNSNNTTVVSGSTQVFAANLAVRAPAAALTAQPTTPWDFTTNHTTGAWCRSSLWMPGPPTCVPHNNCVGQTNDNNTMRYVTNGGTETLMFCY